ncbi:MAG TPA: carboxypeptidase-like regulatory domain-containing protein [Bryobacteraceae bacterium]|nr:carboxypeptidase-like regulatory domain-containing protein [Bryobacteraceae bacterium]
MQRFCLLALLSAAIAPCAVIRGNIVENRTGKPLMRVTVTLLPVAPTPGNPQTAHTDRFGGFEFAALAPGAYVVKASQPGFLPMEYGQKLWNSAGQPVVVASDTAPFLNLRMLRYSGIVGTIRDENEIGMWGHEVVAYRNTQPPQIVSRATSDDRGVYRIPGLEPGDYVVRTTGAEDEQVSYVPTFSKETREIANARIVQVYADEDATGMDIHPAAGKLFAITGATDPQVQPELCEEMVITLASEMGRQTVQGTCAFQFRGLPPGPYELFAEAKAIGKGGYSPVSLSRDTAISIVVRDIPLTYFQVNPNSGVPQIMARRKDLAGVGVPALLQLVNNRALLAPGRWEVMLLPPSGNYVSGFYGPNFARQTNRPDGWNEFQANGSSVRFSLSGGPGEMHGIVKSFGEPAVGAPVYLEAWDPDNRKRVTELRVVRTDLHGVYRFSALAPGTYRALATFEYQMPESATMELAGAQSVRIEARSDQQVDLDLYGIR